MSLESRESPMFPLGSVLLPGAPLPLHIFEPRYQRMLGDVLEGDGTFGVVLITRGFEVGGGDSRSTIGTMARIVEHQRFDDGRAAVIAVGTSRIEVLDWLPEEPYPRAQVIELAEAPATASDREQLARAIGALDALLVTAAELGRLDTMPDLAWPDDTNEAIWQLATIAPIGPLDRQAVLEALEPADRIAILTSLIDARRADIELMGEID